MFDSYFFFFKQKTAYEMRISDWSSDVCSSDLPQALPSGSVKKTNPTLSSGCGTGRGLRPTTWISLTSTPRSTSSARAFSRSGTTSWSPRSDERRVGEEWLRTCRSRWSQSQLKQKKEKHTTIQNYI